jgi:hypothetical protein
MDDIPSDQVSETTFKQWVKEYKNVSKEIQEAGKLLGVMRKRKKQLDTAIIGWMQTNNVARVHLRDDQYLERNIKTTQKGLNVELVTNILTELLADQDKAAEYASVIYSSRPEEEKEFLKVTADQPRKRPRVRPVESQASSSVSSD